jgi:hypothetical protein
MAEAGISIFKVAFDLWGHAFVVRWSVLEVRA